MTALLDLAYQGQQVRILSDEEGTPWFIARDVCAILGIANARDALASLEADEKGVGTADTPGGPQQVGTVNESGLYALIFRSRRPEAKAFRRWVTGEVLPQVRRTGRYTPEDEPEFEIPTTLSGALQLAANLEAERERIAIALEIAAPKAAMADELIDATGDYSVREAAQVLSRSEGIDLGQQRLFALLRDIGWIDRNNIPYQRHVDCGRLVERTNVFTKPKGNRVEVYTQARITPKGLADLHQQLTGEQLQLEAGA